MEFTPRVIIRCLPYFLLASPTSSTLHLSNLQTNKPQQHLFIPPTLSQNMVPDHLQFLVHFLRGSIQILSDSYLGVIRLPLIHFTQVTINHPLARPMERTIAEVIPS